MIQWLKRLWYGRTPPCPRCGTRAAAPWEQNADGSRVYGCRRCNAAYTGNDGSEATFLLADLAPQADKKPDSGKPPAVKPMDMRRDRDLDWTGER